jgi:hypothetical protein
MDQFTSRVTARTALATTLLGGDYAAKRAAAGLTEAELAVIRDRGLAAEQHDREQREQLASQRQKQQQVMGERETVEQEEEHLRNRLPAVIADLAADPATAGLADWLGAVTFGRYHIRVTPAAPAADGTPAGAPLRERVRRADRLSWSESLAQFIAALLAPERAAIIARFEARGMGRERLVALGAAAQTLVGQLGGTARAAVWAAC